MFGHKKGSYTGATLDRIGKFELAHNGDIFLDEIGELPLSAQVKLLRVIQEGEIVRVGDNRVIKIRCRIIAATNQNLEGMVREGRFREDLYHRLNVVRLHTTPLRERPEDLSDLAKLFTLQIGGPIFKISNNAIRALHDYDWPGNIRELRNIIERGIISAKRRKSIQIDFADIQIHEPKDDVLYRMRKIEASLPSATQDITLEKYRRFLETLEREYFKTALEVVEGDINEMIDRVGLSRSTIFKKLKDLGITGAGFRVTHSSKRMKNLIRASNIKREMENSI